jgi:hypothetical protein
MLTNHSVGLGPLMCTGSIDFYLINFSSIQNVSAHNYIDSTYMLTILPLLTLNVNLSIPEKARVKIFLFIFFNLDGDVISNLSH